MTGVGGDGIETVERASARIATSTTKLRFILTDSCFSPSDRNPD
jgi:hypothetical protein